MQPTPDAELERRALRRITRRLLPFLALMYVACYLDRVNVGFAALHMNQAIGLDAAAYGLGAGLFFIGYAIFEVPSNLALVKVGARRWMARIMVTWGLLSGAMFLVQGPVSFAVLRFLLGAAEAGFFPGILYYLGDWYPRAARARIVAAWMAAIAVAGIIGGPLSAWLLTLDGMGGLAGWQWLFLLEALPSIVLGVVTLRYLDDRPADARWLPADERAWLERRLAAERPSGTPGHVADTRAAMTNPVVWQLAALQALTLTGGIYSLGFWLPQILKGFEGITDTQAGLLAAVPYVVAACVMFAIASSSDRSGERLGHLAFAAALGAAGFGAAAATDSPLLALVFLSVAASGILGSCGPLFTLPPLFLTGEAAAAGIALINGVANLNGLVSPWLMGILRKATGDHTAGLAFLALVHLGGVALALRLRRTPALAAAVPSARKAAA